MMLMRTHEDTRRAIGKIHACWCGRSVPIGTVEQICLVYYVVVVIILLHYEFSKLM